MRKMVLTGALVLFGAGTTPQVVAALAICILWFGLIANLKPFGDDADDRLAQVESIQVLFTLLIGLVLQLQALSPEGNDGDEEALGIVLITLNLAVIALAFVQQPIVLTVASRVHGYVCAISSRLKAHRDWETAWLVKDVAAEDEENDDDDDAMSATTWVDVSLTPPRILDIIPLPLELCDEGEVCIGRDGKVIVNALRKFEAENGEVLWIDTVVSTIYSEAPRCFNEVESLDHATHWLDVGEHQLLLERPMRLVFSDPLECNAGEEEECANAIRVWHHRRSGVLTKVNPLERSGPCARKIDTQPEQDQDEFNPIQQLQALGAAGNDPGEVVAGNAAACIINPMQQTQGLGTAAARQGEHTAAAKVEVAPAVHPRGWIESFHETHNLPYYTNEHTGAMVWEKPALPAPPAGWTVHPHAENGEYYHNESTGATLWEHPHGEAGAAAVVDDSARHPRALAAAGGEGNDAPPAAAAAAHPRGWTESFHATHNLPLYTNEHTGEKVWEKPTLPAPPAGWLVCPNAEHGQYYKNIATSEQSWVHPHDIVRS